MLDEDISDSEFDPHPLSLPPLTPTPRALVSQPQSSRSTASTWRSTSKVGPKVADANEKRHRSLKQVSRGHREWTSGLCACREDTHICLWTSICPHVTMSTISDHLDDHCCTAWFPGTCIPMRTKVRTIGGIKGTVMGDCCVMCCCPCLGICQMAREVDHMAVQPEQYVQPVKY